MGTKLTAKEAKTVKFYDEKSNEWVSGHKTVRFWGEWLDKFCKLLPEGKILEVGSGGGRDARELIALGYDYVGTDISEGLLEEARKYNPTGEFFKQAVYDLDFPENSFDGFWAAAVLLHVPKDRIDEALKRVHRVVKDEGVGFISLKIGEGEKEESDGRFFAYYSDEEFNEILERNKFEVVDSGVVPMSEKTVWLAYLVQVKK